MTELMSRYSEITSMMTSLDKNKVITMLLNEIKLVYELPEKDVKNIKNKI